MMWTPYALGYLGAALVAFASLVLAWQRRRQPAAPAMLALNVAVLYLLLTSTGELLATDVRGMQFWATLQYPAIAGLPVLWFVFCLRFAGRAERLKRGHIAALLLVPTLTVVMMATTTQHGLMWNNTSVDSSGPYPVVTKEYGAWFYFHAAYSYALAMAGAAVLVPAMISSRAVYRRQIVTLHAIAGLPILSSLVYILKLGPAPWFDWTPAAFALSALFGAVGMLRYHMLDLTPAAATAVLRSIGDGVLVLDARAHIADMNPAAKDMLGSEIESSIGRRVQDVLVHRPELASALGDPGAGQTAVTMGPAEEQTHYDIRFAPLKQGGRVSGWVVVLRDVTEWRRTEQERDALIAELQQALSSVRTLSGLIPICAACKKVRDDQGYWQQVEEFVRDNSDADFTHALCPECIKKLYPDMDP